ncbi:hypothetical protein H0H92_014246 [Tricholoma furcatifolium]|nr:hypothetical protein H0H92_014246 [Tricholoma furcatifolium]
MFLWPLTRPEVINTSVKRISIRTLIAACIALTTSTVNIVVLAVMKGSELGWVCLGSCTADVVLNALAIFWVTQHNKTSAILAASEVSSKAPHAVQRRGRHLTEDSNQNVKTISMGRFSMSQLRSFDAVTSISPPQSPSQQMLRDLRDIESGRRASRGYRTLRSMSSSVFPSRRGHERTESANLHITVTTECGSEETRFELRPIRIPEFAAFEPP